MSCSEFSCTRRVMAVIIALLILVTGPYAECRAHETDSSLTPVRVFEGGTAYRTSEDCYWVLSLNGSWRQMGRQYGGLVRDELCQFYAEITTDVEERGIDTDEQLENARFWASVFSTNLNELMKGIAESSGLSEDEVLILNAGMPNLSYAILQGEAPSACSGLAVWGRYTPDGALVFGRNWDIDRGAMERYMKYLSIVVLNPDSGNSFASAHPLGNVYVETGMNDKGIFIELNNGGQSDPGYVEGREETASVLATVLNQCSTVDEAARRLCDIPAALSHIIQIADAKECVSVERATFGARVRKADQEGLLASFNSFVPPYPDEWDNRVADPPGEAEDPRYSNLINLANSPEFCGHLDIDSMMKLMDIDVRNGGAVHRGTVYQVVALPQELTMWIRGLGYSGWQQIDLRDLFANR
jgi:hypothetical protein